MGKYDNLKENASFSLLALVIFSLPLAVPKN